MSDLKTMEDAGQLLHIITYGRVIEGKDGRKDKGTMEDRKEGRRETKKEGGKEGRKKEREGSQTHTRTHRAGYSRIL